jgi:hypothetical protein
MTTHCACACHPNLAVFTKSIQNNILPSAERMKFSAGISRHPREKQACIYLLRMKFIKHLVWLNRVTVFKLQLVENSVNKQKCGIFSMEFMCWAQIDTNMDACMNLVFICNMDTFTSMLATATATLRLHRAVVLLCLSQFFLMPECFHNARVFS